MNSNDSFTYFVDIIFGPLVFLFGMTGNMISLVVLKTQKYWTPINVQIFVHFWRDLSYMGTGFNYSPKILSSLGCKVYQYFSYALDAVSPWILVYISVEKFFSISYPQAKFAKLRRRSVQMKSMTFLTLFAAVYYVAMI